MWEAVGVPGPEEQLYEVLVPRRQATIAELAEDAGQTRDRTARILDRLVDRGLVTRLPGRPARFAAVTPDLAAATLIAAWERDVRRLRSHAQELADAHRGHGESGHPAELIEVIEGAANVRNAFFRLLRSAEREVRVFDKPPYTEDQPEGNQDEYLHLSEGKVRYRTLYDQAALTIPGRMAEIWKGIRHGERARVAPALPMKMALSDDRLALIPVSVSDYRADASYLVHPSSLLDALSELFDAVWERAIPLNKAPDPAEQAELGDDDAELLGLLAGGVTDETIARTLGWSVRTVHRHVHRIMASVGAETRFQAGMEAARRGWV
ncbi:MAG: transcriptional regulator [Actinophytocola sp.]|uniref:helix-turn-helix transcriptional regulator n=1 Tax=Actinophytocola sp. TaxID=1872138 RepID=UPI00132B5C8D|nr:LuxR family transcriptional regulator [Actinophytocola sp.]MPZ86322.1 transcriptional regulator [Actinophytocola sp.]